MKWVSAASLEAGRCQQRVGGDVGFYDAGYDAGFAGLVNAEQQDVFGIGRYGCQSRLD